MIGIGKTGICLVVTPIHWESQAVLKSLADVLPEPGWDVPAWRTGDLLIVEPGMGPDVTKALLPFLEARMPREVWLYGCCGGLTPELRVGDLVLADATIIAGANHDSPESISLPPGEPVLAQMRRMVAELDARLIIGPVLTSDHLLASVDQKKTAAAGGAVAVEMEEGPLARWAAERRVPFVHLRVVLDPLCSPLPPISRPAHASARVTRGDLVRHALDHPREWQSLWRLMRQGRKAGQMLTDVITLLATAGGLLAS